MSQQSHPYRTNRDLFSNHYITEHLRQTEPWKEVDQEEIRDAYNEIRELWDDRQDRVSDYNEAQLERNFIRPIFDILEIPFEIEEAVMRNARRPDYGFFPSAEAADAAFDRDNFYEEATAVADAKRWGRKLDTRGKEKRDFENPSYQIHRYLQETPTQWAVLTNGEKWRLYYEPTSHRLDSYYEIDLPELLDVVDSRSGFEAFKEFYLFFRQEAFLPDRTGDCFLDDIYDESSVFAEELGEDLQENIYEAIRVLAKGFLDTNDDLDEDDLDLIHDSSLIYLYRLIFVLYAESEGRDLLPTDNEIYSGSYSLNELKLEVVENRDATQQHYQTWQTELWDQIDELFVLIDQGSRGKGIPKDDLYIPAYNGGLFRTSPDEDDSVETQFLSNYEAGDAYLAEVIELLTRHEADKGKGKVFVDYSSLDERNLGSIYEGLLEYKLDVADEPLTVDNGEYTHAGEDDDITVEAGEVYLRTDDGERKATGSYYTPEYVVEYIVDETLGPLVDEIRQDLMSQSADTTHSREGGFADKFADQIFDLTVLDPAMGSGHFPVSAVDYLARKIIDAQEKQDRQAIDAEVRVPTTREGELRDINWARRKVAQRCIYGVDVNPLATELAKVSLWLRTLAAEQPLAFLDHHLKTGNSLVGSDIEDVLSDGEDDEPDDGQLTLQQSFDHTRKQAMEHVTDRFQDLLTIDNETLEDAKEMEAVYDEVREDPLYRKLLVMANVHTADAFGLDVPDDADERMARALHSEAWENIEEQDWYKSAQAMAEDERFFHWELQFPMAFYDQDGERREDAGFDAVIGNPPWGANIRRSERSYVDNRFPEVSDYESAQYFLRLGVGLVSNSGYLGYIVPNTTSLNVNATDFRQAMLSDSYLRNIVDFSNMNIFKNLSVRTSIFHLSKKFDGQCEIYKPKDNLSESDPIRSVSQKELRNSEDWSRFINLDVELESIIDKIDTLSVGLKDISNVSQGYIPYRLTTLKKRFGEKRAKEIKNNREWHSDKKKTEDHVKELQGSDVNRYSIDWSGTWVKYGDWVSTYVDPYYFENPRLLFREITSSLPHGLFVAATDSVFYHNPSVISAVLESDSYDLYFLVAMMNSSLTSLYFIKTSPKAQKGLFPKIIIKDVRELPVKSIEFDSDSVSDVEGGMSMSEQSIEQLERGWQGKSEGELHNHLSALARKMEEKTEDRNALNLELLDYLGSYEEGSDLPDVGIFQPSSPEYLDTTVEDYENLRVGEVRAKRDGDSVTIEATARYKPEDEDAYETNQWGYTETEYETAFSLAGLGEEEAALIEAFVPVAVDEASGFAGFRETATKTNSLLDRLKAMTLPDPDDIEDDLRRYVENRKRADELDEKIEKTDQLIDEIVYDLYDLTDEEIEIVEEAVADD